VSQFQGKFPFDLFQGWNDGNLSGCPFILLLGNRLEFCWFPEVIEKLKIPLSIAYALKLFLGV
jgi:hypothetical protein